MKTLFYVMLIMLSYLCSNADAQPKNNNAKEGDKPPLKIVFNNLVNQQPVVLYDSVYTNPFGESYTINKFKYYISNTTLYSSGKAIKIKNDYHLINQSIDSSLNFIISLPENEYDSIQFLLGVDSAMNTSGAQTGALDPMNDMFWTWNSGYVMEKLEGTSPQSKATNNKMEYHIGGFSGAYSVLNYLTLTFPKEKILRIWKGKVSTVIINVDINKFWDAGMLIKISDTPVCTSPGILAKQIAGNFSKLFSIAVIINEK
jgi:hypothetical protein